MSLFVPEKLPFPTPADWIWLAGFIDGEGAIGVHRERDLRKGPEYCIYRASLQITQTSRGVLEDTQEILGGGAITLPKTRSQNHAQQYHYMLRKAETLFAGLEQLTPFLRLKQPQARLVHEFLFSRLQARGRGRYAPFISREIEIAETLRVLNLRGGAKEVVA